MLHKSTVLSQVHSLHSCAAQEDGAAQVGSPFMQKITQLGHKAHPWLHPQLQRAGCVHAEREGKSHGTGALGWGRWPTSSWQAALGCAWAREHWQAGAASAEIVWFRQASPPEELSPLFNSAALLRGLLGNFHSHQNYVWERFLLRDEYYSHVSHTRAPQLL